MVSVRVVWLVALSVLVVGSSAGKYDEKKGRHNITMGHRRTYPQYPVDIVSVLVVGSSAGKYDEKKGRHNITMGHRRTYPQYPVDMLLIHDNPRMSSSILKVQSHDVCYPQKGQGGRPFTISMFNVTDLVPRNEGGLAFVTEGGVNMGRLCLHLKTQRGNGYNFKIDIFGYYI